MVFTGNQGSQKTRLLSFMETPTLKFAKNVSQFTYETTELEILTKIKSTRLVENVTTLNATVIYMIRSSTSGKTSEKKTSKKVSIRAMPLI